MRPGVRLHHGRIAGVELAAQPVAPRTVELTALRTGSVAARNEGSAPIRTLCTAQKLTIRMRGLSRSCCILDVWSEQVGIDDPGMAGERADVSAGGPQAAVQLIGEQQVGQLGLAVSRAWVVLCSPCRSSKSITPCQWPWLLMVTIREPGVASSASSSSPVSAKWPRWLVANGQLEAVLGLLVGRRP